MKPEKHVRRQLPKEMKPFQWKQGQSGNPKGRPRVGLTVAELFRAHGQEIIDRKRNLTRIDVLIRRLYADAINGKYGAAQVILDRGWGKVAQPIVGDDGVLTKIVLQWSEYDGNGNRVSAVAQEPNGGEAGGE